MALTREWVERKIIRLENAISMCKRDGLAFIEQKKLAELCHHWLATQWQPIETAPKDGSWFIGSVIRRDGRVLAVTRARWFAKRKLWQDMECDRNEGWALTNWVPEPPATNPEESQT